jgi:hypothetical protein
MHKDVSLTGGTSLTFFTQIPVLDIENSLRTQFESFTIYFRAAYKRHLTINIAYERGDL